MANVQSVAEEIAALPAEKQEEVADFVAFLRTRVMQKVIVGEAQEGEAPATTDPSGFVGMWADRTDMPDSAAWVRRIREGEWESRHA